MNTAAKKHFRSYRPLRQRIERHQSELGKLGFHIVEGHDLGWFGDGRYVLSNEAQLLRITRSRGEEFLEVAFEKRPAEEDWFDVSELLTTFDVLTFEEVVEGAAIRHDLNFKLPAYFELYAAINAELSRDRTAFERRLQQGRQRDMQFTRERYGKPCTNG